jgi:cell shape-determining protein MreC
MERGKTGTMPPGINGKILSVNRAWNFVVLNVGNKDGVVENGVLMVYRGNTLLGKVKVVSAEKNSAVADVIPEWIKGDIQPGDAVFN